MPLAWGTSTGSGVNITVLDTGYRPHPDIAANIVGVYNMIVQVQSAPDGVIDQGNIDFDNSGVLSYCFTGNIGVIEVTVMLQYDGGTLN